MGLFSVPCALFNLRRGRHRIPPADDLTESPAITGHCNPGDYNDEKKTPSHFPSRFHTQGLDRTEQPLAGFRQTRATTARDIYKTRPRP